jgi:hypothetical protein
MQQQIVHIAPFQNAKVMACLYFVVTIPFVILFALFSMFAPGGRSFGIVYMIFAPFLYALGAFVFSIIGAWIYNFVAKFVGGFEYTSNEVRDF